MKRLIYQHAHENVDIRISEKTVEIFLKGSRIAAHVRLPICYFNEA
jgi:hypothetical protein